MNNKQIPSFKKEIKSIDVSFNEEDIELFFNSSERKFLKVSYCEYRIFKQIDGVKKIKMFKNVDLKDVNAFLEILKSKDLIFFSQSTKSKNKNSTRKEVLLNQRFSKIIKDNFENKKILIIGCDDAAIEVASELAKLNAFKFILWDYYRNEKIEDDVSKDSQKYWNKIEIKDSAWRSNRIKARILKINPSAQIDIIPSDVSTYELTSTKNWLSSGVDFGFVFAKIANSFELILYDLFEEYKIPWTIIFNYKNFSVFGPIIQSKNDETKDFIQESVAAKEHDNVKSIFTYLNLNKAKFLAKNLVHEIILFFLDREECKILNNKINIDLISKKFYTSTIFSKKVKNK